MILFYRKEKKDINKLRKRLTESSYFTFLEEFINKNQDDYRDIFILISNAKEFKPIKEVSIFRKIIRCRYIFYKVIHTYLNRINPRTLIYEDIIKS